MNQFDQWEFNQAVTLAQAGKKEEAYARLKPLVMAGQENANLFLWLAFTTPDMTEAEKAIKRAHQIDPNDNNVNLAKTWLLGQKAKTLPAANETSRVEVLETEPVNNYGTANNAYQNNFSNQPMPNQGSLGTYNYGPPPAQQPVMVFPQTVYMPYPTTNRVNTNHVVAYLITTAGVIGTLISVFLAWVTVGFTTGYTSFDISFNGLGSASGSSALVGSMSKYDVSNLTNKMHGGLILFGLMAIMGLIVIGAFTKNIAFPALAVLGGLGVLGGFVADYFSLTDFNNYFNRSYNDTYGDNAPGGAQLGPGLMIGVICALVMTFGIGYLLNVFSKSKQ